MMMYLSIMSLVLIMLVTFRNWLKMHVLGD